MKTRTDTTLELADATERYVAETLHAHIELAPWPVAAELPPYLRSAYRFMTGEVRGRRTLWLLADEPITPKTLQKNVDALAPHWQDAVVAVFRAVPSYVRQRLIQRGIAFVVPGTQLYLPDFGLDFRERGAPPPQNREHLRPSAQLLLLYLLLQGGEKPLTASAVALELGYSLMTMSRAVAELEAAGLIQTAKAARAKTFSLASSRHGTWDAAQTQLRTPVLRRAVVPTAEWGNAPRPLAGLSALAEYTMLAAPATPVRATDARRAREAKATAVFTRSEWESMAREEDEELTEVWSYDPLILGTEGMADRLSLYLSLRNDADERVQSALVELLGGLEW